MVMLALREAKCVGHSWGCVVTGNAVLIFEREDKPYYGIISDDNDFQYFNLDFFNYSYLFHYITEDKIVYMCITDDDFERSKAFLFLNEIKRRFQAQYGVRAQTALPYAMNSDFSRTMASQMRSVSEDRPDQVSKVQTQVDELKCIMVKNIDHLAERGEKLELLVDKTEDLSANVIIYFIVSAACGGLDWPCTK
uniref:AP-3 complex subunit delta-1 n=1 Tax=Biomphalaria glabrata TaxID=6526 RepID=A0A2C9M262_BIOGL